LNVGVDRVKTVATILVSWHNSASATTLVAPGLYSMWKLNL
jgi:hypothetical protein